MRNYVTEFIGTFILSLTVGMALLNGTPLGPLAAGAALMGMVYMGGHVSGGHYNPAVSLAALLRGALPGSRFLPYVASQFLGAITAGIATQLIMGNTAAPVPGVDSSTTAAMLSEVLFTAALCLVALHVTISKETAGNSHYGLAIGFTLVAAAYADGGVASGVFNPAVDVGLNLVHRVLTGSALNHVWLYVVGPLVGGALAALAFRAQETGQG